MFAGLLNKFATWAISKNPPGGYAGEDDTRWAYTIYGEDGTPYLTRVLLTRVAPLNVLKKLTGIGVYLHHFHRPDGDQAFHDHPWRAGASLILNGAYVEERVEQIVEIACDGTNGADGSCFGAPVCSSIREVLTNTKLVRFWNYLTGDDFHAVRSLRGDVWTLFLTRGRFQDWGFLVDGVKVPWREYLSGLDAKTGEALDALGKKYFVQRKAEVKFLDFRTTDYCRQCGASPDAGEHLPHGYEYVSPLGRYSWVETDNEYRERIRAAMRAQAQNELEGIK